MIFFAVFILSFSLSKESSGFEILDPNTLQIHPVKRCWPLSPKVQKLTYISCSDLASKNELSFDGACSNNDPQACDPSKNPGVFTNQGDGGQLRVVSPIYRYQAEDAVEKGERKTSGTNKLRKVPDPK